MLSLLKDWASWVMKAVTFDMTPEEKRVAARLLSKVAYRVAIICSIGIAFGGHFAVATDVDKKINDAVTPLREEQAEQRAILNSISTRLNASLAKGLASDIRLLYARLCKETDLHERERLIEEIDDKQEEYRDLKQEKYGPLTCGAV